MEGSGTSGDKPAGGAHGGGIELQFRVNVTPVDSENGFAAVDCEAKVSLEEPDAVILHVRICGSPG